MRNSIRRSFIGACALILLTVTAGLTTAQTTAKLTLKDLTWLAGCWEKSTPARTLTEQWMAPAGGLMMGMGRTVKNGQAVDFEFVQLRQDDAGDIFYIAKPMGQPEASFKLITSTADNLIFENAEHDFPQRVIYRHLKDGSLAARIDGTINGQSRAVDFPMDRGHCN